MKQAVAKSNVEKNKKLTNILAEELQLQAFR